jgi:DNA polymerase-3 subunit epsilon
MNIITFDVETTGLDPATDRIVELAFCAATPGEITDTKALRFNPGIPIPAEATAIHGISDDDVCFERSFEHHCESLFRIFSACDVVVGYNVHFDIQFLAAEFERHGLAWPQPGLRSYDAFKVYQQQRPRNLADAFEFYTGTAPDEEQLHSAGFDVDLTWQVFSHQLVKSDAENPVIAHSQPIIDPAGKLGLNDQGQVVFLFGKHQGLPVIENPDYAQWMLSKDFPMSTKRALRQLLG